MRSVVGLLLQVVEGGLSGGMMEANDGVRRGRVSAGNLRALVFGIREN
jgi:hypothetical protein